MEQLEHVCIFIICCITCALVISSWLRIKKLPELDKKEEVKDEVPDYYKIYIDEYELTKIEGTPLQMIIDESIGYELNDKTKTMVISYDNVTDFSFAVNILVAKTVKFHIEFIRL